MGKKNNNKKETATETKSKAPQEKKVATAPDELTKALQKKAQECKTLGNTSFTKGDFAEAAAHFTSAISLDSTDHVFFSNRSACYCNLKKYQKALEDANTCVTLAPVWAKGYNRVASALFGLGRFKESQDAYNKSLEFDPGNAQTISSLAEAMSALEISTKKAAEDAKRPKTKQAEKKTTTDAGASASAPTTIPSAVPSVSEENNVVIGIDLGTTYSCVAVWRCGRVQVLENAVGERTTPSYAAFTEDGERLVGQPAKQQAARNIPRTFFNIKRIIGRTYKEASTEISTFPFTVIEDKQKGTMLIETKVEDRVRRLTPEEISAMVLEKMKQAAEAALGHPVKRAVITVPAYFNDAQRRATKTAGMIAGLTVERIINEPTAAALAYGLDKKGEGIILVFDLGGGTFDVSLLKIEEGMFQVLATTGDTYLGGEDFDLALVNHVRDEFKKQRKGKDLFADSPKAQQQLRTACERAKRHLSTATITTIEVCVGGEDLTANLSRATFEKLNKRHFDRCLTLVKQVLDDAKLAKSGVDDIVLVGGSTRIPYVRQMLETFFDGKPLCQSVNPDEAVAYGAAVQGAILAGVRDQEMLQLVLLDVTPLTLGIETEGRIMSKIVQRNTPVPCSKTKDFTTIEDWQTEVDIPVYEGERGSTDGNHFLGEFAITGVERAKMGIPKIDVTFHIDINNILTVTAKDRVTGAKADITIAGRTRHSDEDIDRMIADAERMREEDQRRAEEAEAAFAARCGDQCQEEED